MEKINCRNLTDLAEPLNNREEEQKILYFKKENAIATTRLDIQRNDWLYIFSISNIRKDIIRNDDAKTKALLFFDVEWIYEDGNINAILKDTSLSLFYYNGSIIIEIESYGKITPHNINQLWQFDSAYSRIHNALNPFSPYPPEISDNLDVKNNIKFVEQIKKAVNFNEFLKELFVY